MNNSVKILIVDDDAIVRRTVSLMLSRDYPFAQIADCSSLEESIEIIKIQDFDLVVLDMNLSKSSGLSLLPYCSTKNSRIPVLAMSSRKESELIVAVFKAGANGFITKDEITSENCLKEAVECLLQGQNYIPSDFSSILVSELQSDNSKALSEQEQKVLLLIAGGQSVKEIASNMKIAEKTVRTYRARLLEKLNLSSDTDIVRYAIQSGFIN